MKPQNISARNNSTDFTEFVCVGMFRGAAFILCLFPGWWSWLKLCREGRRMALKLGKSPEGALRARIVFGPGKPTALTGLGSRAWS